MQEEVSHAAPDQSETSEKNSVVHAHCTESYTHCDISPFAVAQLKQLGFDAITLANTLAFSAGLRYMPDKDVVNPSVILRVVSSLCGSDKSNLLSLFDLMNQLFASDEIKFWHDEIDFSDKYIEAKCRVSGRGRINLENLGLDPVEVAQAFCNAGGEHLNKGKEPLCLSVVHAVAIGLAQRHNFDAQNLFDVLNQMVANEDITVESTATQTN